MGSADVRQKLCQASSNGGKRGGVLECLVMHSPYKHSA